MCTFPLVSLPPPSKRSNPLHSNRQKPTPTLTNPMPQRLHLASLPPPSTEVHTCLILSTYSPSGSDPLPAHILPLPGLTDCMADGPVAWPSWPRTAKLLQDRSCRTRDSTTSALPTSPLPSSSHCPCLACCLVALSFSMQSSTGSKNGGRRVEKNDARPLDDRLAAWSTNQQNLDRTSRTTQDHSLEVCLVSAGRH